MMIFVRFEYLSIMHTNLQMNADLLLESPVGGTRESGFVQS